MRIDPGRFVLGSVSEGGILLDLESGILFQLNRTARFIWERALEGLTADAIAQDLNGAFTAPVDLALADVARALSLPANQGLAVPASEYWYELIDDVYRFSLRGNPVLEVASSGRALRAVPGVSDREMAVCLRAVSPKVASLLRITVLHASSVVRADGTVMAFLGDSGAGKTTTARMFVSCGLTPLSEDKLVLRGEGDQMVAVLGGEPWIEEWLLRTGARLIKSTPGTWTDVGDLESSAAGAASPISELVLIDKSQRRGDSVSLHQLDAATGATVVFLNAFQGSSRPDDWRDHVTTAAKVARSAKVFSATLPVGLGPLEAAIRRYIDKTAS